MMLVLKIVNNAITTAQPAHPLHQTANPVTDLIVTTISQLVIACKDILITGHLTFKIANITA
jgi:hypothetical protein